MKKVLVLFCSKNLNGKTAKLLNFYLKKLKLNFLDDVSLKFISSYNVKILPCDVCNLCSSNGGCVFNFKDDFLNLVHEVQSADIFVLASNVFFSGLPAHVKAFIDRCEQFYLEKLRQRGAPLILKLGYFVLTGGNLDKLSFMAILNCVKQFFWCLNINFESVIVAPKTDVSDLFFLVK